MANVAVITFTEEAFSDMLKDVVAEGVKIALGQGLPKENKPKMVNTANAKKMLYSKGYHVTTYPSFNDFKKKNNLNGIKKGKEFWYQISDIDAIPSRI